MKGLSKNLYLVLFAAIAIVLVASLFLGGYISTSTPKGKFTGITTFQLNIYQGFNFISVPYSDFTVTSTDCDIDNNIYHWNSVNKEYVQPAQLSDLRAGLGYWFVSGKSCSITFRGTKSTETDDIGDVSGTLKKGFSQIGGPIETINLIDYKGECVVSSENIYYWNAQTRSYENPVESIEPGKAYWIVNNNADCPLKSSISTGGTTSCVNTNDFCGGIANIQCCSGLTCQLEGDYADAGGKCIEFSTKEEVNTVAGTDTQVPQAIPLDSSISPTPVFPMPQ